MADKNPAAVALGRLGGQASGKVWTEAKREASRKNGLANAVKAKGKPRPKKASI